MSTDKKILGAALKVFSKSGYRNATTKEIASEAGINEATLFRKFKSKENLFNSVVAYNYGKISDELNLEHLNDDMEPRKCLDSMINSLIRVMENNEDLLMLLMKENSRIVYGSEIDNFGKVIIQKLQQFSTQDCGINFEILSITIFNFFIIIHYESFGIPRDIFIDEFKEYVARILQI
jgi:AcrR family transcriptional regulator